MLKCECLSRESAHRHTYCETADICTHTHTPTRTHRSTAVNLSERQASAKERQELRRAERRRQREMSEGWQVTDDCTSSPLTSVSDPKTHKYHQPTLHYWDFCWQCLLDTFDTFSEGQEREGDWRWSTERQRKKHFNLSYYSPYFVVWTEGVGHSNILFLLRFNETNIRNKEERKECWRVQDWWCKR